MIVHRLMSRFAHAEASMPGAAQPVQTVLGLMDSGEVPRL